MNNSLTAIVVILVLATSTAQAASPLGTRFIGLHFKNNGTYVYRMGPLPDGCKEEQRYLPIHNYWLISEGVKLYLTEMRCAGEHQIWLLSAIDDKGNRDPQECMDCPLMAGFQVEDALTVPPHAKNQTMLETECDTPFVLGTKVRIKTEDGEGYRVKDPVVAWRVNYKTRKFDSIPINEASLECVWGG
jgi:hypothetical protein